MELKEGTLLDEEHLFVTLAMVKKTRGGKPYVEFNCRNTDGMEVNRCKIWGTNLKPPDNTVIKVMGRVDNYEGHLHYVINSWDEDPDVEPEEFEKKNPLGELTPDSIDKAWKKWLNLIGDDHLKKWTQSFINFWSTHTFPDVQSKTPHFDIHPAAQTVHHAYKHGLIEHTMEVMRCASSMGTIMNVSEKELDLCTIGAAIHDIGKLVELEQVSGVAQYSNVARYYGWGANAHLHIGSQMLLWTQNESTKNKEASFPDTLSEETFLALMNIILSHHGEFGDVKPNSVVSQIVHLADLTSTRINTIQCALEINGGNDVQLPAYGERGQNILSVR